MNNHIMIYPYAKEHFPILKQLLKDDNCSYYIVSVLSWMRFDDAGKIVNRENIGLYVENDFYKLINECNELIILNSQNIKLIETDVIEKMEHAIQNKIAIKCFMKLNSNVENRLKQKAENNGVKFNYYSFDNFLYPMEQMIQKKKIKDIEIPVIFIGEIHKNLDSLEVMISLGEQFRNQGYKVLSFTSEINCYILGESYIEIPRCIIDAGMPEPEKVFFFNNFIHKMIKLKTPDVIIIQLLPGMLKLNSEFVNDFGIYTYLMSQAVKPDYFILSNNYELMSDKYFEMLSMNFSYRFGCYIDMVVISNKRIDFNISKEYDTFSINYYDIENIESKVNEFYNNTSEIYVTSINKNKLIFDKVFKAICN